MTKERLNEKFIDLMDKLSVIMSYRGDFFRAKAYKKAEQIIMSHNTDIVSPNDLKGKLGIGKTIMDKLIEYYETGKIEIIEMEKSNPLSIFCGIYGIGPKKAQELLDNGIKTISQLRENQNKLLNNVQKIGLQYYEDILERIPRSEIEEYKTYFQNAIDVNSKIDSKMEIVGSYRRGAETSSDIDVIITSKNQQIFINFVDYLLEKKIILHILSRGKSKCLVIAKINNYKARRVDFLFTSPEEFPFAILYFTGSKIFNTYMRQVALDKGYTMNEHGIYKLETKRKTDKVERIFKDEKDIFDFLEIEYKMPHERIDGRSIILHP